MSWTLPDLIDIPNLRMLMERFHAATGIPAGISGRDGELLVATGWRELCTSLHRCHPVTAQRCRQCDDRIKSSLSAEDYVTYKCRNGLWDMAMPIMIAGEHCATLFLGQFFYEDEEIDEAFFPAQALEFGFDTDRYMAALRRIPVFSRNKVQQIMDFYTQFVDFLVKTGLANRRQMEMGKMLQESEQRYREIFYNTSDCIFLLEVTSDGRFKFAGLNPAEEKTVGLSSTEVSGRFIEDVVPEEIAKGPISHYRHCMETGTLINYDEELDLPVGHRHFHTSLIPLHDASGRIYRIIGIARDITERKRAEEALRESEEKFAKSFRATPSILVISTMEEGRYIEVNETFELVTGYLREEVIGRTSLEFNIWETPEARTRFLQELRENGKVRDLAARFRNKSGELMVGQLSAEFIEVKGEQCLLILVNDITARKLAEEALKVSEAEKSLILNSTSDLVIYHDIDIKVVWGNRKALESVGMRQEELVGRHCWGIWHQRSEACEGCPVVLARNTGEPQEGEIRSPDGREWYIRGFPVKDDDGRIKGVVEFCLEITERKRAENALMESKRLLESEKRFRSLFEHMLDGVAYCRMLYDDNGCPADFVYLDVNNAFSELTGLHDVIGKKVSEVLPGIKESSPELFEVYGRVALTGRPEKFEIYIKQLSLWRSMSVYSTEKGHFVAVFENITERKRVEAELRESHFKLRELTAHLNLRRERERKAFARKVHDELGTSLTLLKFDLAWLKRNYPPDEKTVAERIRAMDELIHECTKTIQRITSELRPSLLDEQGLAATIEWQAKEFEKRTGISCRLEIDTATAPLSQDKAINVFRIFQESLSNVMRHACAASVVISLVKDGQHIVLRITDNGVGISDQEISSARSFGILGMEERARLCGGEFTVKGIPGKGTTISVSVPT